MVERMISDERLAELSAARDKARPVPHFRLWTDGSATFVIFAPSMTRRLVLSRERVRRMDNNASFTSPLRYPSLAAAARIAGLYDGVL